MKLDFISRYGKGDSEGADQYYKAFVSYKEDVGEDDYSFSPEDQCEVKISPAAEGLQTITVNGQSPTVLLENAVLAFLGEQVRGDDDEQGGLTYTFEIEAPALPARIDASPVSGVLTVTALVPANDDDDEAAGGGDAPTPDPGDDTEDVVGKVLDITIKRIY
jgi:hypothetical protein